MKRRGEYGGRGKGRAKKDIRKRGGEGGGEGGRWNRGGFAGEGREGGEEGFEKIRGGWARGNWEEKKGELVEGLGQGVGW